jgi:hypothetical protein
VTSNVPRGGDEPLLRLSYRVTSEQESEMRIEDALLLVHEGGEFRVCSRAWPR